MTNPLIKAVDQAALRTDIPDFRPGDSVRVHVRVIEGSRSRIQVFAGVVIARNAGGVQEAFTVRKVSFGIGVERTFPLHSPIIEKIEVERRGDVRRAKLYYLRGLRGKAAKIKESAPEGLARACRVIPGGAGRWHFSGRLLRWTTPKNPALRPLRRNHDLSHAGSSVEWARLPSFLSARS